MCERFLLHTHWEGHRDAQVGSEWWPGLKWITLGFFMFPLGLSGKSKDFAVRFYPASVMSKEAVFADFPEATAL